MQLPVPASQPPSWQGTLESHCLGVILQAPETWSQASVVQALASSHSASSLQQPNFLPVQQLPVSTSQAGMSHGPTATQSASCLQQLDFQDQAVCDSGMLHHWHALPGSSAPS